MLLKSTHLLGFERLVSKLQTVVCSLNSWGKSMSQCAIAYYRVSTQRQGRSGLASRRSARPSPGSPRRNASPSSASSPRWRPARATTHWIADHSSPSRSLLRASGPGHRCQARPTVARRRLHRRPDGTAGALHRRRTRRRCRSLHAAPLRSPGREGTAADLGTHPRRPLLT
jgi:hypothetical protein